jgi:hypothetical protein
MSDETHARGCEDYENDLAELALGVLTGRDRASALTHVDSCPRCAEELEQLSRAADAVVLVAPETEPPLGFDVRLFERMGVTDVSQRRSRLPRWVPVAAAAAVVALATGLGLGLSSSSPPTVTAQNHAQTVVSANLVEHGQTVGRVVAFGGSKPWMSMMLADSSARGTVNCVVVTTDGVTHQVGTFVARQGYGAWLAPLKVSPSDIRSAEVVAPSGTVLATATLG